MPETPSLPRPSLHELVVVTEELARLAEQGLSLEMGLDWLSEEGARKLRDFSAVLKEHLDKGEPLDSALTKTAELPEPYLEIVRLGVAGNQPGEVLRVLLWTLRGAASLRNLLAATVVYPLFVCFVSLGVFLGYCRWGAPAIGTIAADLGISPISSMILAACTACGRYWVAAAIVGYGVLAAVTVGVVLGVRSVGRVSNVKRLPAVLLFPGVYHVCRIQQAVTGARLWAICLKQGLPPAEALRSVAALVPADDAWREKLRRSADAVKAGTCDVVQFPGVPGAIAVEPQDDPSTLVDRLNDHAARWQRVAESRLAVLRSMLPLQVGWIAVALVSVVYAVYWIPYLQLLFHLMFEANTI
ncbi:hypothetical protein JCM19992_19510 [Thermostilla marina]